MVSGGSVKVPKQFVNKPSLLNAANTFLLHNIAGLFVKVTSTGDVYSFQIFIKLGTKLLGEKLQDFLPLSHLNAASVS